MKSNTICLLAFAGALGVSPAFAAKNAPVELGGVACSTPPPMHCPDANCGALVTEQGTAVEPKTGRKYFLDYPCDLKKNEKVTFILALHGGGSYGNWQRHYFPIVDFKDKYRLVIATTNISRTSSTWFMSRSARPTSSSSGWSVTRKVASHRTGLSGPTSSNSVSTAG
jgi:hypothetical protein